MNDERLRGPDGEYVPPARTTARFRVALHLDGAREATISIDRDGHQIFSVRPLGKRTVYEMSLADVAEMVAYKIAKAEAERKVAERRAKRKR